MSKNGSNGIDGGSSLQVRSNSNNH